MMKKEIILFLVIGLVANLVPNNELNAQHSFEGKQSVNTEKDYKVAYVVQPKLERFSNASIELEGRQQVFQQAITQHWLLGIVERNPYMLGMFEEKNKPKNGNLLPWSGEFAGKNLTGGIELYRLNRDPELKRMLDGFVNRLCDLQTPSGYLGPWSKEYELTNRLPDTEGPRLANFTWDTWNHYQIMIGLMEYHRLCGDIRSLETCRRIGDRLCAEFLNQPDKLILAEKTGWGHGCMEFNLTPAHSLCLLYRATGEVKYLELSRQIVTQGFLRYGDYLNRALAGKEFYQTESRDGNRWERLHTIMALAELYWLTGEEKYRKAFEFTWWSIAKTDIHNTGGFSTYEAASGNPYADGWIETCCTVAWQAMSVEMLKMTRNPVIADMLELAQLNAAYGSWDLSGSWSTYHTGTVGERRPSTVDIAFQIRPGTEQLNCCSVNAPRGLGLLADWAVMRDSQGLALNWYGPGKITAEARGVPVSFTQTTDYPRTGEILIRVEPHQAVSFSLSLRIPFWSVSTTVEVNGKVVTGVKSGSYLQLDRKWRPGDKIKLALDMRPHFWPGENQYMGFGSIYHGPILLAWRKPVEPINISYKEGDWKLRAQISYQSNKVGSRLVAEFTGDHVFMIYDKNPDGGQTRLLIDGVEQCVIDHYSPILTPLVQWQSPQLKPGRHEFVIEVLKECDPASKGNWARLRELRLNSLPILDVRTLRLAVAPENSKGIPWLRFTASDAQGRKIELEDFDSAGKNSGYYYTWLPLEGLDKGVFSYTNPLRSVRP
jgi:DUF1680 family protein